MRSNYSSSYMVDLVFCIDTTGSMAHIIDIIKTNALNFYEDVARALTSKHKNIDKMRIRIVAFKDFLEDHEQAMLVSDFFSLPEQEEMLRECVESLAAEGGGDIPEDGLEALALAIKSDWCTEGVKRRHIIVVWTDASTHPLGYGASDPYYPPDMPRSFEELSLWWGDEKDPGRMDPHAKRLLMFAPDENEWRRVVANWDNTIHVTAKPNDGLSELDYEAILSAIYNSI